MKRDLGLIRELLLKLEPLSDSHAWQILKPYDPRIQVEGYTPGDIEYNLQLLVEQGLIEEALVKVSDKNDGRISVIPFL